MTTKTHSIILAVALTAIGCSSTRPVSQPAEIDPTKDPSAIGAVAAAADATADAMPAAMHSDAATTGRRIGMAVGLVSAIAGGRPYEPIQDSIARYRAARDLGQAIGASKELVTAAGDGMRRGFAFDQQMLQLKQIDGIDVTRPAAYQLDIRFNEGDRPIEKIAQVVTSADERFIVVEGRGAAAVRDSLIGYGVNARAIEAHDDRADEELTVHVLFQ